MDFLDAQNINNTMLGKEKFYSPLFAPRHSFAAFIQSDVLSNY